MNIRDLFTTDVLAEEDIYTGREGLMNNDMLHSWEDGFMQGFEQAQDEHYFEEDV